MASTDTTPPPGSSATAPIPIVNTKSNSSLPTSPANSVGSRGKKRERDEDESLPGSPPDPDAPITKKRKTPPTETQTNIPPISPYPGRVAKIQERVRELSWEEGSKTENTDQQTTLAPSTSTASQEATSTQPSHNSEAALESSFQPTPSSGTPHDQPASGRSSPTKLNGSKYPRRFGPGQEKPIEVDVPEKSLKRKASDRIYGAPNPEPAQKRSKEDDSSVKSTIPEEVSQPQPVKKHLAPELTGFAAFASGPSPFAMVKSDNSPFGKGPSKSTIFGSSTVAPSFSTSFTSLKASTSWSSAFKSSSSTLPSVFSANAEKEKASENGDSEDKGEGYDSSAPPPSKRVKQTPVFGSPSLTTSKTPKFGATSVVGQGSGSIYAKSPFSTFSNSGSPSSGSSASKRRAKSPRPQAFGAYGGGAARFAMPNDSPSTIKKAELESESTQETQEGSDGDGANSAEEDTSRNNSLDIPRPISRATNDKSPLGFVAEKTAPSRENSFAEMLASSGKGESYEEDEKKPVFSEPQTIVTGEEDEVNIFSSKAKLYYMDAEGQWKERGAGTFKLNMSREEGVAPRMIMRRDGSLNLLLNAKLFKGMHCAAGPDPRYISLTILDESLKPKAHLLRVNTSKLAQDLLERIQAHIPK